ncbi:MAG: putative enzyme related to lactoylglutathione lyase [Vicingaceae bacterium]|jgi:predicted enzyme related to lactoylglutathione lyase
MKTPSNIPPINNPKIEDNYISWFEIPALNFQRAVNFYNSIYQIQMETNEMNGYSMAFFPSVSAVGGAIICGEGSEPCDKGALLYLNGGEDLNQVLNRVESSGGRVLLPKQQINEDAGYFALFIDSEGNKLALHSIK